MSNWRRKDARKKEIAILVEEGRQAALAGKNIQANPHRYMNRMHWDRGFESVQSNRSVEEDDLKYDDELR